MGKAAREQHRLQEMAGMAANLEAVKNAKFMVAGIQVEPAMLRTQFGPVQGVALTLHMGDGSVHETGIFDPVSAIQLIAGVSGVLAGKPGTTMEEAEPPAGADPAQAVPAETVLASGLILP